jgi:redox-sensing transcriptional repressor
LTELEAARVQTISSLALAERFHLNAAQIRKDLAYFGEFGVRGVGYYVTELKSHLRTILGLDQPLRVGIIGAGNLGRALADYQGFRTEGFKIVALFDNDPDRIGRQSRGGVLILHADEFSNLARAREIDVAMVAVPGHAAQAVVDLVVQSGIRAILNFSPGTLNVPRGVKLKNVDPTVSLESLSFFLARGEADGSTAT